MVVKLLASSDRRRAVGCRDYAIVLLLVRLGLRSGEVAAMQLDDIDWRAGEMLHRLRHTAATRMLGAGYSLAEVGQVLRHVQLRTTAIYAKVDYAARRPLALPWPEGGAA